MSPFKCNLSIRFIACDITWQLSFIALVPCCFGIGVQGEVVEELKVSVQHEAGISVIGQVVPVELPLWGTATGGNILEKMIKLVSLTSNIRRGFKVCLGNTSFYTDHHNKILISRAHTVKQFMVVIYTDI